MRRCGDDPIRHVGNIYSVDLLHSFGHGTTNWNLDKYTIRLLHDGDEAQERRRIDALFVDQINDLDKCNRRETDLVAGYGCIVNEVACYSGKLLIVEDVPNDRVGIRYGAYH